MKKLLFGLIFVPLLAIAGPKDRVVISATIGQLPQTYSLGISKGVVESTAADILKSKGWSRVSSAEDARNGAELLITVHEGGRDMNGPQAAVLVVECALYVEAKTPIATKLDRLAIGNNVFSGLYSGDANFVSTNIRSALQDHLQKCLKGLFGG